MEGLIHVLTGLIPVVTVFLKSQGMYVSLCVAGKFTKFKKKKKSYAV